MIKLTLCIFWCHWSHMQNRCPINQLWFQNLINILWWSLLQRVLNPYGVILQWLFIKDTPHCSHINVFMQERRNSIASTLELCLSCTNPSIWEWLLWVQNLTNFIIFWLSCSITSIMCSALISYITIYLPTICQIQYSYYHMMCTNLLDIWKTLIHLI